MGYTRNLISGGISALHKYKNIYCCHRRSTQLISENHKDFSFEQEIFRDIYVWISQTLKERRYPGCTKRSGIPWSIEPFNRKFDISTDICTITNRISLKNNSHRHRSTQDYIFQLRVFWYFDCHSSYHYTTIQKLIYPKLLNRNTERVNLHHWYMIYESHYTHAHTHYQNFIPPHLIAKFSDI